MAHLLPPAGMKNSKHEAFMFNKVYSANFFKRDTTSGIPPNIHDYRWTDHKEVDRRCQERDAAIQEAKNPKSGSTNIPRSKFNPAGPCPSTVKDQFRIAPCPCPQHRGVGYKGGRGCACMADRPMGMTPAGNGLPLGGGYGEGYGRAYPGGSYGVPQGGYDGMGTNGGAVAYPHAGGQGDGHLQALMADQGLGYCPPIGLDPRCLVRPRNKALHNSVRPTGEPYFVQESKPGCPEPHDPPILRRSGFTFDDWLQTVDKREPPPALRDACIPSLVQWCKPVSVDCKPMVASFVPLQYGYCY